MAIVPSATQAVKLPSSIDWIGLAKTLAIGAGFIGSLAVLYFGHPDAGVASEATQVAIATGSTLGVLRLADILANVVNTRAILNSPTAQAAGVIPSTAATPLLSTPPTAGASGGSADTSAGASAI